jgi:hypothetical protein
MSENIKNCSCSSNNIKVHHEWKSGRTEYWVRCFKYGKRTPNSIYPEEHAIDMWNNNSVY